MTGQETNWESRFSLTIWTQPIIFQYGFVYGFLCALDIAPSFPTHCTHQKVHHSHYNMTLITNKNWPNPVFAAPFICIEGVNYKKKTQKSRIADIWFKKITWEKVEWLFHARLLFFFYFAKTCKFFALMCVSLRNVYFCKI